MLDVTDESLFSNPEWLLRTRSLVNIALLPYNLATRVIPSYPDKYQIAGKIWMFLSVKKTGLAGTNISNSHKIVV